MLVPRQSPDFPHRADVSSLRVTPAYSLNTLLNAEIPGLRRRSNIHSVIATAKVSSRLVLPIAGSGGEYYTDTASDRGSARGDPLIRQIPGHRKYLLRGGYIGGRPTR